jgi:hypothetical protein
MVGEMSRAEVRAYTIWGLLQSIFASGVAKQYPCGERLLMRRPLLPIVAATLFPVAVDAAGLAPLQAEVSNLGPLTVVTYYVARADGFHVIVTVAKTDGEASSVVRFSSVLADGQQAVISVPREAGRTSLQLMISRQGQTLSIGEPAEE